MKIDTSKIEGYAEMTAEEKLAVLEGYEMQVDTTGMVEKRLLDKANSEAASYKKQLREQMSEAERKAAEEADARTALETRLKELENEKKLSDYRAEFSAIGYDDKNAVALAQALVDGDMKTVFGLQKSFIENQRAAIKAELLANTPKPENGTGKNDTFTREKFAKLSLAAKQAMYASDPDLYKQMTE